MKLMLNMQYISDGLEIPNIIHRPHRVRSHNAQFHRTKRDGLVFHQSVCSFDSMQTPCLKYAVIVFSLGLRRYARDSPEDRDSNNIGTGPVLNVWPNVSSVLSINFDLSLTAQLLPASSIPTPPTTATIKDQYSRVQPH
jgi:hypothetical protein